MSNVHTTILGLGKSKQFPGITGRNSVDFLMERILNHDDYDSFEKLFQQMYTPLCQYCLRFVHVREVSEELVSDVFYTIWKNRARIEVTSPRSYLFTAVRNRGLDYLRKAKRSTCCNLDQANQIAAEALNSQELMIHRELDIAVSRSIASLPKQCRLIFELSRDHGLKYREIALKLRISVKTVETQMGRALKHLRQSLAPLQME
jgi:RNA polymerase sigma-70 factor (family 1)